MTAYACLQEAYLGGDMGRERYERTLKALKFVDEHGRIWSIGHQTGGWYYNFNFQWYPGELPIPCWRVWIHVRRSACIAETKPRHALRYSASYAADPCKACPMPRAS